MNSLRKARLIKIITLMLTLGVGVGLILYALRQNINLFYTPSTLDTLSKDITSNIRVGGFVKKGSIIRGSDLAVSFVVTDHKDDLTVHYKGILPDLFKEQQGVVVMGKLHKGKFIAEQVLAKHDENYVPKELKDLKST